MFIESSRFPRSMKVANIWKRWSATYRSIAKPIKIFQKCLYSQIYLSFDEILSTEYADLERASVHNCIMRLLNRKTKGVLKQVLSAICFDN